VPPRIVVVNDVWQAGQRTPGEALERFTSLTGWAAAVRDAGGDVTVLQRFHCDAEIERQDVAFRFVADRGPAAPSRWFAGSPALRDAAARLKPDVVHVNGLDFPVALHRLRAALPRSSAIAVQDHGGFDPAGLRLARRLWMRRGLRVVNALLVATPDQADAFRASGLVPRRLAVYDVMEASTDFRRRPAARANAGLSVLWVGRLNANKDPLTVLEGFAGFAEAEPRATLTMVYDGGDLEPAVRAAIEGDARLRPRAALRGFVPHPQLEPLYAAADVFVLGSAHEGSGYAVIEAMACGAVPVLPDIASFRGLTGRGAIGVLWRRGDAASLSAALTQLARSDRQAQHDACCRRFAEHYSWEAIGRRALAIYRALSRS
jgi:glycosyltransferase involved in cell wall biosynthesis